MEAKSLTQINLDAVRLTGLLKMIHSVLPDDQSGNQPEINLLIGLAADIATQLANDVDDFDMGLRIAKKNISGGSHEQ